MAKKDRQNQQKEAEVLQIQEEPALAKVELVEFETWFALRGPKIPGHHRREILKADFTARGIREMASMQDFDEALNKYGVKLA